MSRPTKYTLSYAQKVWDNYNPYYPLKEPSDKELLTHKEQVALKRLQKAYTKLAELAGYETSTTLITIISKKALRNV